jgi:enoyl-CoA hydratase
MVRALTVALQDWQHDPAVAAVAIRGSHKGGPFGGFCAGGDIRFFHRAALAGNPELEDFFTEECALNHLIHTYGKPYIAFMDAIVRGGGMGISQGASHRLVMANIKMAMPERLIGLFPDVGGGYFLSRCPGRHGEWLALTGEVIDGRTALAMGLADHLMEPLALQAAWDALANVNFQEEDALKSWLRQFVIESPPSTLPHEAGVASCFSAPSVSAIVEALQALGSDWAATSLATLRKRAPLMLHVTLEQIRRARTLSLADDLRMERDLARHCFAPHHLGGTATSSETVEGIRALAIDKDHQPRWNPARIEDVTPEMVEGFFESPWPRLAHPLADLGNERATAKCGL